MTNYKIVFNRDKCIGAYSCVAVAPELWKFDEDEKATLIINKIEKDNGKLQEAIISEDKLKQAIESAEVCPVQVIKIINMDTGEEVKLL